MSGAQAQQRLGRRERMSREFVKYHLGDGKARHHFTGPDRGGPHDHPCRIDVEVMSGGYVERAYYVHKDGSWSTELIARNVGDRFTIDATHIHEIVELPQGECWTEVQYHPHERETRFWRFDGRGARSVPWHRRRWLK